MRSFVTPKKDSDGLSVNIHSRTDVAAWLANFNRSFGADSLHTGRVRDIHVDLDVGQPEDGSDAQPDHAVIAGLPFSDDNPELAESLASRLVEVSRTLDRTQRGR